METNYYHTPNGKIAYYVSGTGVKPLLCLHGYGESAEVFNFLLPYLNEQYLVVCIDFPHHGKSDWPLTNEAFLPSELLAICEQVFSGKSFSILAFSMGGRVALQLLQIAPQHITKMVLLAPDGFHKNFWQWFATQTYVGKKCFAAVVRNPSFAYFLLKKLVGFQWFSKSVYKFADSYLHIPAVRQQLFNRWMTMRKFTPHLPIIQTVLAKHPIQLTLVFGKYDRIILAKHGYDFLKNTNTERTKLIEWHEGHQLLKAKHTEALVQLISG